MQVDGYMVTKQRSQKHPSVPDCFAKSWTTLHFMEASKDVCILEACPGDLGKLLQVSPKAASKMLQMDGRIGQPPS